MTSIPRTGTGGFSMKKERKSWNRRMLMFLHYVFIQKGWIFVVTGFLLGRAVILSEVSPFALAFVAAIWLIYKEQTLKSIGAVLLGALSYSVQHSIFLLLAVVIFMLLAAFFKRKKNQQILVPLFVVISMMLPRIFLYSIQGELLAYEWILLAVEGILGAVLVLIFMQSLPLISPKKYRFSLRNEEIVCMMILLVSILTGMIGWHIYGAAIEQIFARYFVLVFAFVGGAAIGSTVGVVAGLVLSLANVAGLYQMSLLAFSGLLGGLLKEGKKPGVAVGLLIGTFLISMYGNTALLPSVLESLFAILIFFLTPAASFRQISRFIPGTEEYTQEQERFLQKIRDLTAKRVEQFSEVFGALAKSFALPEPVEENEEEKDRETDYFLSLVTERTCQSCFLKNKCWVNNFDKTYHLMEKMKEDLTNRNELHWKTKREFDALCMKSNKVEDVMKEEISIFEMHRKMKKQLQESKRLVHEQLLGVSEVMGDFAKEMVKERKTHELQEHQIIEALKKLGIELEKVDIYSLEKGNIDIEITANFYDYHGEAAKLIAPVLSDILDEMIIVNEEDISPFPNGTSYLSFRSAKEYCITTGYANAAKGGGFVSGDSFLTMELGRGKFAMAISDGMGNGYRAKEESEETLRLLQQILQTGIPEKVAIKSINSVLSLRSNEEMFATLDLAMIDLNSASAEFLKIGSSPSFIMRGKKIIKIEAGNLPIGIIRDVDVDIVQEQLKAEDILIMVSDGIFEGPMHVENTDIWMKRKLRELETRDPQEVADLLLEEVIRTKAGEIDDDMTVLVAKIERNKPKWASIPFYEGRAL